MGKDKLKAFTLVELLVVMAVISMLLAITMPSLSKAREQGRRAVCLTHLHSIGQGLYVYAHDNNDALVPGDYNIAWNVWAQVGQSGYRQVNLGYLMKSDSLPLPDDRDSVFFCPSMRQNDCIAPDGSRNFDYQRFHDKWGRAEYGEASINYMFNIAIDGSGNTISQGQWPILSHKDKIQYLSGDGSSHTFNNRPEVYDDSAGAERLQEVSQRYGVNFPAGLLHKWLAAGTVDVAQARAYLKDPQGWANSTCAQSGDEAEVSKPIALSRVGNESLVCDVMGVWGGAQITPPIRPPG